MVCADVWQVQKTDLMWQVTGFMWQVTGLRSLRTMYNGLKQPEGNLGKGFPRALETANGEDIMSEVRKQRLLSQWLHFRDTW